jgi:GNAT superfamily N-acetyltransferase
MSHSIRVMQQADLPVTDSLLQQSYGNPQSFLPRLERHLALEPEGWLVAESDGVILGCGGATTMGSAAYIGLVGVSPGAQRQGIATSLMHALIVWCHARGCVTLLLDASDAGQSLYLGLDFEIDDLVGLWRSPHDSFPHPAMPNGITLHPYDPHNLAEILAFDARGFGAPRDRIVTSFLADDPAQVTLARDPAGTLCGYLALQSAIHLAGPWLAATPEAAIALFASLPPDPALTIMLPMANVTGVALLRDAGFTCARTLAHMRLGPPLDPVRRQYVFGQINFAFG